MTLGAVPDQQIHVARLILNLSSVLAIAATFLPWFRLGSVGEARRITPALESYIGVSTLFLAAFLGIGICVSVFLKSPIFLGVGSCVYTTITIALWLFGSRTSSLLPKRLVPDDFTVRLNFGADVGVVASLLMVVAIFVIAFELTWANPIDLSRIWLIVVAAIIGALLISSREASWVVVDTFDFEWRLTVDSIPVIGDAILVLLLASALFVIAAGVFRRTSLVAISLFLNAALLAVGSVGWFARNSIVNIGEWASRRADFLEVSSVRVADSYGPIQLSLIALASLLFSLFLLFEDKLVSPNKSAVSPETEMPFEELSDPY